MFDKQVLGLGGAHSAIAFCCVMSVVQSLLVIGQAVFLSLAIVGVWDAARGGDAALARASLADALWLLALFAVCFCARQAANNLLASRMEAFAHNSCCSLRRDFLGTVYDSGSSMIAEYGSAGVVTQAIEGMHRIENYIAICLPRSVAMIVQPLCIAVAVFSQDVISGIIVLVCYPFIIAFMRLIGHSASDESAKRHAGFVTMSNYFMDSLRGISTLKAFGADEGNADRVFGASERYREQVMKTLRIAMLSGAVLDLFATMGLAAVAIMLGFRMVEGTLAFLPALIVLMLVPEYFMPIRAYAKDYHASLDGKSALAKLSEMRHAKNRVVEICMPVSVPKGAHVALMGSSGSGKTTLLDVISGMVACPEAALSVDAVCAQEFGAHEWQRRVAYIPQSPHVFSGTLRENVALYRPQADDGEVLSALDCAGMRALVESFPDGLDTRIGDGGRELSGGEAHRIALARALVDPARDVWLIDEPGSNLDIMTEREFKEALLPFMEGRTVIVATHRAHWAHSMDYVLDLDERKGAVSAAASAPAEDSAEEGAPHA